MAAMVMEQREGHRAGRMSGEAAASVKATPARAAMSAKAALAKAMGDGTAQGGPAQGGGTAQDEGPGAQPGAVALADHWRDAPVIAAETSCAEALALLRQSADLPCLVIAGEDGLPAGLLMRDRFYRQLAGRFAPELFYARPAADFADGEPLTVEADSSPGEVIRQALLRPEEQFYDCVLVTESGRYRSIVTVKELMNMSSRLQLQAEEERSRAVSGSYGHLESIASSLRETAEAARATLAECRRMEGFVREGSDKLTGVRQSVEVMENVMSRQRGRVAELLQGVGDITAMTDEIGGLAERSGLLALNAAIEAAHAGEHGRGFQVVAGEVRALAMRTRQLASGIANLLERIGRLAAETSELTGDAVREIGDSTGRMAHAVSAFAGIHEAVAEVERAGGVSRELIERTAERALDVQAKLGRMGDFTRR